MRTFAEFWPFYLREHSRPATRALHFAGTTLSLLLLASAVALRSGRFVLMAIVCGYAFAWVGHFFVEHNRPATFKYRCGASRRTGRCGRSRSPGASVPSWSVPA